MRKSLEKPKIEGLLKAAFPQIGKIRLHSARYDICENKDDNEFVFEFLIADAIDGDVESEIQRFLEQEFKAKASVKFVKSYFDEDFLERKFAKYFSENNGFLQNKIKRDSYEISREDDKIIITFLGDVNFCGYVESGIKESLEKYLYRSFIDDFEVRAKVDRETEEIKVETTYKPSRAVEVAKLKKYIGQEEGDTPAFICDIEAEYDRAILCGVVSNIAEKIKKNPVQIGKNLINEKYYTFELKDVSGSIGCLIFPSVSNNDKVKRLEGKEVVVCGRIKMGRLGEFQMMAKSITLCEIKTKTPPPNKLEKDEPMYYSKIFPEEVVVYEQDNMLEQRKADDLTKLQGKTIVVFDLETTGISPITDKIVEIGAVKLVDGKFTEKFSTLVNPEVMMSETNMKIHGISNEDVKLSPVIDDVILDFYKFCHGAILCGHNSKNFDIPFIRESARKLQFDFLNEKIDTLELAIAYVKGVRNNQLGTLCAHFGINNERAHRAYQDAIATGQLLIRILSEIPEANI
ncbi:MAG: exonuclease domain-containing protein [Clostridia bacterium]